MIRHRLLRGLLAVPLTMASLAATSVAHADVPATAPQITTTFLSTESGGLSAYLHLGCWAYADFTDSTLSDSSDYALVVNGQESRGSSPAYDDGEPIPGAYAVSIGCEALVEGTNDVTVREYAGDTVVAESQPMALSYRVIGHPEKVSLNATKIKGTWSLRAGQRARLTFTGEWEAGAKISTQVWTSKTRSFASADWDANVYGKAAIVSRHDAKAVVKTFTVPERLVGRWAWISVVGRTGAWGADGVNDFGFTFIPLKIAAAKR